MVATIPPLKENQSNCKKERMDLQSDRDLLSNLPLSIIHIILDLIPLRDAVRTSILSREWRYTWASLPHLNLDRKCVNPEGKSRSEIEDCMKNIVAHVLSCYKGPIHKFKMSFCFESSCPDIDEWILRLSRNDIKELILYTGSLYHLSPQVHSSMYSCEKLTRLEIQDCGLDPPPSTFKGFLFLRCLYLYNVVLSPNTFESLVANSLLEKIELIAFEISESRISAPNLKSIVLSGKCTEICMYAPLLSEMVVRLTQLNLTAQHQQQNNSVCPYINVIGSFTNLEKLSVGSKFVKYLSMGIDSCHRSLVFHHLKDIELYRVNFEDIKELSFVARLITGAPNLDILRISTNLLRGGKYDSDSESSDVCFSDFGCAPDFSFTKLRFVVMTKFTGFHSEVGFLVFLLQSSPVFETMIVEHLDIVDFEEQEFMIDELRRCTWASPKVKLYTRGWNTKAKLVTQH